MLLIVDCPFFSHRVAVGLLVVTCWWTHGPLQHEKKKRKEKTTLFSVNLLKSQVLSHAAQVPSA